MRDAPQGAVRELPRHQIILGVLLVAVLSLASCRAALPHQTGSSLDRRMAVLDLQNLSDYVGFGAHFEVGADDRTLVMLGSDLCDPDFPAIVPPRWWQAVVDGGFETFECRATRVHVRIAVQR